jgi:dTDP-4-dehydrorhamnose 3,5-epimerase-like enzyme
VNGVDDCKLIDLPRIESPAGNITPVDGGKDIPFDIARVYYMYDVVGGAVRGGHAHKHIDRFIVAAMGGFTVLLWDGEREREVELNRAYRGLYVPTPIWTDLVNFSSGAVCVVLASDVYSEADYIRDRGEFVAYRTRAS